MKPITVNGTQYKSISAAMRAESPENVSIYCILWRLKNGWSPEDAILTPRVPPEMRRKWKSERT